LADAAGESKELWKGKILELALNKISISLALCLHFHRISQLARSAVHPIIIGLFQRHIHL